MPDSRTQFTQAMENGNPVRVPLFEEGIRPDVIDTWSKQGLSRNADLSELFNYDPRLEIYTEIGPLPEPEKWPTNHRSMEDFRKRFNPDDIDRMPSDASFKTQISEDFNVIRILRVHRGFFITGGVNDWSRFKEFVLLAMDDPDLVREILNIQGQFAGQIAEKFLAEHAVEAALFSEPIGGNHGPLVSPKMYAELIIPTYRPIFNALAAHGVSTIIWRTYADTRTLLPLALEAGINCLWACECGTKAMDYQNIRTEFGPELRLIGGIDLDILHGDRYGICREVEKIVPPLLEQGRFLPLLDGRVRKIVAFEKYKYYRHLLEEIVQSNTAST